MLTFIATFSLFGLAILGMAVGVMLGRRPIAGSCGGLNNPDGCTTCSRPCRSRDEEKAKERDKAKARSAARAADSARTSHGAGDVSAARSAPLPLLRRSIEE
ncbi:MAG: hypothetical protein CSB44_01765 [Gammaproteobacteria bacterium]|nr:MAG: hypothetical protein CSB44_01765 [Gammaproteobacteria bacterium]PIE38698.1 MAG: hypothetical protein CSA54_00055 [Gammaproteobacteria bacterium]